MLLVLLPSVSFLKKKHLWSRLSVHVKWKWSRNTKKSLCADLTVLLSPYPGEEQGAAREDHLWLPGWQRRRADFCGRRGDHSYRGGGPGVVGEYSLSVYIHHTSMFYLQNATLHTLFLTSSFFPSPPDWAHWGRSGKKRGVPHVFCAHPEWLTARKTCTTPLPNLGAPVNSYCKTSCHTTSVLKKRRRKKKRRNPRRII